MSSAGPAAVHQSRQKLPSALHALPSSSPPGARKRARRPPPVAVPERPPTSLPTSFYNSPAADDSNPREARDIACHDDHVPGYASAHCRKGTGRRSNEDRFSLHVPKPGHHAVDKRRPEAVQCDPAIYGVYDGHGGVHAADYAMNAIPSLLRGPNVDQLAMHHRIASAFHATDADICARCSQASIIGTTACVAVISSFGAQPTPSRPCNPTLRVAHAGDSRALLVSRDRNGTDSRFLTADHSASRPDEVQRIHAAGGHILNNRVNGILAVSRALGDLSLKPAVIATPDVTVVALAPHHRYLVLATDGVWTACSGTEVCSVVEDTLSSDPTPDGFLNASKAVADFAVRRGSTDDIAVVVVNLQAHWLIH